NRVFHSLRNVLRSARIGRRARRATRFRTRSARSRNGTALTGGSVRHELCDGRIVGTERRGGYGGKIRTGLRRRSRSGNKRAPEERNEEHAACRHSITSCGERCKRTAFVLQPDDTYITFR